MPAIFVLDWVSKNGPMSNSALLLVKQQQVSKTRSIIVSEVTESLLWHYRGLEEEMRLQTFP